MADLLDPLDSEVSALAERADFPGIAVEEAFVVRDRVELVIRRAREMKDALDALILAWMKEHDAHEVTIGDMKWVAASKKKERPRSIHAVVETALQVTGGDVEQICGLLSSSAIKVGAARKMFDPAKFEELFEVTYEMDLEHKPVKQLTGIDQRFVK